MFKGGILVGAGMLGLAAAGWSDEIDRGEARKHRVPRPTRAKVASALPTAWHTLVPYALVSLEDLTDLAEKLKANGDVSSAVQLHRYVREQTSLSETPDSAPRPATKSEPIWIEIEAFELNSTHFSDVLDVRSYPTIDDVKEIRKKLDQMVIAKKATVLAPLHRLRAETNQAVQHIEKQGEVEYPASDGDQSKTTNRDVGFKAKITAKSFSDGKINLQQTVELSMIDQSISMTVRGKTVPGLKTCVIQSTNETIAGQPVMLAHPDGRLIVFTTVSRRQAAPDPISIDAHE